jgi:hypothetical protein
MWISKIEIPSCKLKRKIWATPSVQGDHQDSSIFDPSWELARFEKFFFFFLKARFEKSESKVDERCSPPQKCETKIPTNHVLLLNQYYILSLKYFLTFFYIWCQSIKYQTTSYSKSYLDISLFGLNVFKGFNCFIYYGKCLTIAICFAFKWDFSFLNDALVSGWQKKKQPLLHTFFFHFQLGSSTSVCVCVWNVCVWVKEIERERVCVWSWEAVHVYLMSDKNVNY